MKEVYGICFVYYEEDLLNHDEHIKKVTILNYFERRWELYMSDCEVSQIVKMLKNSEKVITLTPSACLKSYEDLSNDEYAVVTYKQNKNKDYITTLPDDRVKNNLGSLPNNILNNSYWDYIKE
jgi:hypothetical protein